MLGKTLTVFNAYKVIVNYLLIVVVAAIPFFFLRKFLHFSESSFTNLIGYILVHFILIVFLSRNYGFVTFKYESKIPIKFYLAILVATLAMIVLLDPLESLVNLPDFTKSLSTKHKHIFWIDFIELAIAAPIMEEIIFRKILLARLLKVTTPLKAIVHVSLIWGIIHLNPIQTLDAFFAGIFIGFIYLMTKSIWPCIFAHFVNNSISCVFSYYSNGGINNVYSYLHNNIVYLICYLASIIIFVYIISYLQKSFSVPEEYMST